MRAAAGRCTSAPGSPATIWVPRGRGGFQRLLPTELRGQAERSRCGHCPHGPPRPEVWTPSRPRAARGAYGTALPCAPLRRPRRLTPASLGTAPVSKTDTGADARRRGFAAAPYLLVFKTKKEPRQSRGCRRTGSAAFTAAPPLLRESARSKTNATGVPLAARGRAARYFRCCARYLFISNIVHLSRPNTFFSFSSARISRLSAGFWRLCFRI